MNITRNGDQKMLNEIIIGVLVIVVLFEAIMVSAISQRRIKTGIKKVTQGKTTNRRSPASNAFRIS